MYCVPPLICIRKWKSHLLYLPGIVANGRGNFEDGQLNSIDQFNFIFLIVCCGSLNRFFFKFQFALTLLFGKGFNYLFGALTNFRRNDLSYPFVLANLIQSFIWILLFNVLNRQGVRTSTITSPKVFFQIT